MDDYLFNKMTLFFKAKSLFAYRGANLGLTFSIYHKLKDLRNIFMYQRNELALNKILSIKPLEVIWYMLRKLGFKLNIIEAELNSPDAFIKQSIVCSNLNEI